VARRSRFPARGGKSERRHEARRLMLAVEDATLRSHGPCIVVLQKSSGRSQALRSAPSAASGSKARARQEAGGRCLAKGGTPRARKRTGRKGRRGNGESELGDPHHVNAHAIDERVVVVRASARAAAERLAMEGISDRRSVCPSRGPRGVGLGGLRALASNSRSRFEERESGGGDRDASGSHVRAAPRKKTPGEPESAKERSEDRVVKRGPPRSHLHRAAPSFSVPAPLVTAAFTGGARMGGTARGATSRG